MSWPAVAGGLATTLFVLATLPMVIKARRSRDLRSYSGANLVIANCGNLLQSFYVVTLPPGPIWGIHFFNVLVTALMLYWWVRFGRARRSRAPRTVRSRG